MGFTSEDVDRALSKTKNSGLQPALDYLTNSANQQEDEVEEESKEVKEDVKEPVKELTLQEKMERTERLQQRIKERRLAKEEEERLNNIEKEKSRIQMGKDVSRLKEEKERKEMEKLVDERKRQKNEDRLRLLQLRDEIKKDREDKKIKFANKNEDVVEVNASKDIKINTEGVKTIKIQIRKEKTNEVLLVDTFSVDMTLKELYDNVYEKLGIQMGILTNTYPRKRYDADEMMNSKLSEFPELFPSSSLILINSR